MKERDDGPELEDGTAKNDYDKGDDDSGGKKLVRHKRYLTDCPRRALRCPHKPRT